MKKVCVIIPTRKKLAFVKQALRSLFASVGHDLLDVVVIEQGGEDSKEYIETGASKGLPVRWMAGENGWSFSQMNNAAAATAEAEYLLLLNNDVICRKRFLEEMLEKAEEGYGLVGAKLLHLDGSLQHIGVMFGPDGVPYHLGFGYPDDGSYLPATRDDDFDAITFACALVKKTVWDEIGGLDEAYFFNYEDVDFCLKAREKGHRIGVAVKAVCNHLEGQSRDYRTSGDHGLWRNLKILRDRWIKTGRLQEITGQRIPKDPPRLREEKSNIAYVPGGRNVGVPWWRCELPARKLSKLNLANVQMLYGDEAGDLLTRTMDNADVAVFQGFWSDWVRKIAALRSNRRFAMVYDYDDCPISISPFSQAYRDFGTQEISFTNKKTGKLDWLWRDGQDKFDLNRNIQNRQKQLEIFSLVDAVTTTTVPLYEYFKTLNPNVVLLPNMLDFDIYRHSYTLWERKPGPVRIGWFGGDNHYHDIDSIGAELVKYVNEHEVQLVLFGAFYRGALSGIDLNKVCEEPWVHIEAFPYKLASLGIDVGLVPLADPSKPFMKFNHYKSDIKLLEFSAMRIPSLVVAGRTAYAIAEDGENCLTYATPAEFTEKLGELCGNEALRKDLGGKALDYVRETRDLEKNAHRWIEAYETVKNRRDLEKATEPDRPAGSAAVPEGAVA